MTGWRRGMARRAVGAVFLVGAAMLLPIAAFADWTWAGQPTLLLGALFAGIATLALAYRLFAKGIRHLGPPTAVLVSLLEPVAAATFAVFLVGQTISLETSGALLILAGVGISVFGKPTRRAVSHPVVYAEAAIRAPRTSIGRQRRLQQPARFVGRTEGGAAGTR
jgi:drug/metabolite transporter, DME family